MRYTEDRTTLTRLTLTVLLFFLGSVAASAAPPAPGEPAPPFRFLGVEGLVYESADFFVQELDTKPAPGAEAEADSPRRGRAVVIAWFPKAFTPG